MLKTILNVVIVTILIKNFLIVMIFSSYFILYVLYMTCVIDIYVCVYVYISCKVIYNFLKAVRCMYIHGEEHMGCTGWFFFLSLAFGWHFLLYQGSTKAHNEQGI